MSARGLGPIARSVAFAAGVGLVVAAVSALLQLSDDASHSSLHLNVAVPGAVLLGHALATWSSPGHARAAVISRRVLLIGIAVVTVGQFIEAVGAFGRWDRPALNRAHDVGVLIGPIGVIVVLTGRSRRAPCSSPHAAATRTLAT
ncbi:MAG TPA: hypothetical protein VNA14_03010 [Mycobacteriales bacterium]|nr:hypothetical protein [Mycobacteriales bacterium]